MEIVIFYSMQLYCLRLKKEIFLPLCNGRASKRKYAHAYAFPKVHLHQKGSGYRLCIFMSTNIPLTRSRAFKIDTKGPCLTLCQLDRRAPLARKSLPLSPSFLFEFESSTL